MTHWTGPELSALRVMTRQGSTCDGLQSRFSRSWPAISMQIRRCGLSWIHPDGRAFPFRPGWSADIVQSLSAKGFDAATIAKAAGVSAARLPAAICDTRNHQKGTA